ncbi:glycosyltransferase family 4 protein [Pseudomonadota bacterium]
MKPQVVLFVHYGSEWIRGSERCLLDLLTHLDRKRFQPVVWCNAQTMADEVEKLGVDVCVDKFPLLLGWDAPRFDVSGFVRLVKKALRLVRQHNVQLLHANSGGPCQWLGLVSRFTGIPLLAHLHSRYLLRERCSLGIHQASYLIGVSQPVLRGPTADGMPKERMQVIHNGIDFKRMDQQLPIDCRQLVGAKTDELLMATTGSLIHRKGVDLLLGAMQMLKGSAVRLAIIGDGDERPALERMALELGVNERVVFLGERADVAGLLRGGVDLFVSAAREEVFGLVLAEAASAGLPVIAPRVGGIPEVVDEGVTGELVAPESPEALSHAIKTLAANKQQRHEMGRAGRERVERLFSAERYVDQFQSCYEQLLSTDTLRPTWHAGWRCSHAYAQWVSETVQRRIMRWRAGDSGPISDAAFG